MSLVPEDYLGAYKLTLNCFLRAIFESIQETGGRNLSEIIESELELYLSESKSSGTLSDYSVFKEVPGSSATILQYRVTADFIKARMTSAWIIHCETGRVWSVDLEGDCPPVYTTEGFLPPAHPDTGVGGD